MAEVMGIDVSKHQGSIDWQKVKKDGVQFAIIRAGYGKFASQEDPEFSDNIQNAYKAGIPVGVYWYSYAGSVADAEKEADVCLRVIKPFKALITLPVFFDQEYEPGILALNNRQRTDCCLAFIKKIQAAGYQPGMYASYDWFKNKIYRAELLDYPAWVAQYASKCQYTDKNLYMWQYSSTGKVNGISGNVDKNYWYKEFAPQEAFTGWKKSGSQWYYYEADKMVKNAWRKITGVNGSFWYFLGANGVMLTGTQKIGGKIYHLNEKAACGLPEGALVVTDQDGVVQF